MLYLFASVAISYACAGSASFWLRKEGSSAIAVGVVTIVLFALSPCVIPPERTILRGLAAFFATDLAFKVVDYLRQRRRGPKEKTGSVGEYFRFLIPFPIFLAVLELRNRRLPEIPRVWPEIEIGRFLLGAAGFTVGGTLLYLAHDVPLLRNSFAADHVAKLFIVVILVESASQMFHSLERLGGYDTSPPMQLPFISRTVGEFWWRWNYRVHVWLHYNVFLPVGGRRAPIRGVLHCFFWSGVLHEITIGIASSRIDGYQFTFFMLQAPAVLISRPLERFADRNGFLGKVLAHGLTISWISATSILFFHGIDRVFGFFYVSQPWLP